MRRSFLLSLSLMALLLSACEDTPTSSTAPLGKVTVAEFVGDVRYSSWFPHSYEAYPGTDAAAQARFTNNVAVIRTAFDSTQHSIVMVVSPTCSCQKTQQTMPQVMKVIDAAGVPHNRVEIWITDTRLAGIDALKSTHTPPITASPVFIVMKGNVEKGRIQDYPDEGKSVEEMFASFFAAP